MNDTDLIPAVAEVETQVPKKPVSGEHFVVFVGDTIPDKYEAAIPFIRFGGALRMDESKCLRYRSGYVRRCEITQLRIFWDSVHINNIAPSDRKHLAPIYELTEGGKTRIIGIDPTTKMHDGLLRSPFYPSFEVDILTSRGDGLVRVPCKTPSEALLAQKFLFPNWNDIFTGKAQLPDRCRKLREYFHERKAAARNPFETQIADTLISACDQYLNWCNETAVEGNSIWNSMHTRGLPWTMGAVHEAAFRDSSIQRVDTVAQNQAGQFDKMTEAITTIANSVAQNHAPAVQSSITDDPEYQEYLKFKAWKAAKAAEEQQNASESANSVEFVQCKGVTKSGEQCRAGALENGYCHLPAHQAQSATAAA